MKVIIQQRAIEIVENIDPVDAIKEAYKNGGVLWFDLSRGELSECESQTSVKLIVLRDIRDYIPRPEDKIDKGRDLSEEERDEIEDEIEKEKERLEEMDNDELEEEGLEELEAWAMIHTKELRDEWENKVRDFYVFHKLFKKIEA